MSLEPTYRRAFKEASQFRIDRNRRRFKQLKMLIEALRRDPFGRIDLLIRLQDQLAKRILRTEKGLKILKLERARISALRKGGPSRGTSIALKSIVKRLELGIARGKHLLWIWRCFGDAIPFIYHDKHSLKHMLYSIEDYSVKQAAGALYSNEGRHLERKIMRSLCRKGFPAVLSDLTNTLRHGDVCVMVGPDPFPIEVKSSRNQNARTVRQIGHLASLHAFYSDDGASDFRGVERVERRAMPMEETYAESLNSCVERSRSKSWFMLHPEDGLTYLTVRRGVDFDRIDASGLGKYPSAMIWNHEIDSEAWMPYYPFTLTLRRASDLVCVGIRTELSSHCASRCRRLSQVLPNMAAGSRGTGLVKDRATRSLCQIGMVAPVRRRSSPRNGDDDCVSTMS